MATSYKKSVSGLYHVEMTKSAEFAGFLYKPGLAHVVNEEILQAILDSVTNVRPAD